MDAKLYITEIINELTFVKDSIREDDWVMTPTY